MKPTLLVLAAGMGSRYGGIKQIDTVGKNGECLLDYAAYDAKKCGFEKIVYIIRKDIEKDFRERLFDRIAKNIDAEYVFQSPEALLTADEYALSQTAGRKKPWGTLHAVLCAKKALNTPYAVINADDYYGRSAFETLGKYLSSIDNNCRNGSVSRGICQTKDGYLESITENTKIYYTGENFSGNEIESDLNGTIYKLTGNETVSMNLFGFTPAAFDEFEKYWDGFKKTNLEAQKAEALLPVAASQIIKDNKGKIKVFTSEESWFGMTYAEDKQVVKDAIAEKIASGYYPEKLWDR